MPVGPTSPYKPIPGSGFALAPNEPYKKSPILSHAEEPAEVAPFQEMPEMAPAVVAPFQEMPEMTPEQQKELEEFLQMLLQMQMEGTQSSQGGASGQINPGIDQSGKGPNDPVESTPVFNMMDPNQLGIPLNPLFNETFNSNKHLFNLLTKSLGGLAFKFRAIPTSAMYILSSLGFSIKYGVPSVLGGATAAASLYVLKNNVEHLLYGADTPSDSTLGWAADKAWTVAKIALSGYVAASGVAALGTTSTVVGLLLTGGSLMTMITSRGAKEANTAPQSTLGWVGQKALTALKIGAVAYGLVGGISSLFGYSNAIPGIETLTALVGQACSKASFGKDLLLQMGTVLLQYPLLTILPLGVTLAQQLITFGVLQSAMQSFMKEINAYNDSEKYAGTYQQLSNISQEEYQGIIAELMGAKSFQQIAPIFEPLRTVDPQFPENAARAVIAKLYIVDQEVRAAVEKYSELVKANRLKELGTFVAEELKPKLLLLVYLKQCLLFPNRPELGDMPKDGTNYQSLISHLYAQLLSQATAEDKEFLTQKVAEITEQKLADVTLPHIKMSLTALDPNSIIKEMDEKLMQEVQLQNFYYQLLYQHRKMMEQLIELQKQQQSASAA